MKDVFPIGSRVWLELGAHTIACEVVRISTDRTTRHYGLQVEGAKVTLWGVDQAHVSLVV